MFRRSFVLIVALAAGLLAGCTQQIQQQRLPNLTYSHLTPFNLAVARVETASEFTASLAPPHVEHDVPEPPENALRQWASDRLKAGGGTETARFTIVDAGVTETRLAVDKGVSGLFKKEQASRYDAAAEARLEMFDDRGFRRGVATSRVTLSRTIGEDMTLNERDKALFALVEDLMKSFDAEMEKNIRQHLGGYLF